MIPRIHLFELEDQPWFPSVIRDLATDYLHFMETLMAAHRPMVPLLADALRSSGATTVVDLCAGGGGPVVAIREELARAGLNRPVHPDRQIPELRRLQGDRGEPHRHRRA